MVCHSQKGGRGVVPCLGPTAKQPFLITKREGRGNGRVCTVNYTFITLPGHKFLPRLHWIERSLTSHSLPFHSLDPDSHFQEKWLVNLWSIWVPPRFAKIYNHEWFHWFSLAVKVDRRKYRTSNPCLQVAGLHMWSLPRWGVTTTGVPDLRTTAWHHAHIDRPVNQYTRRRGRKCKTD